MISRGFRYKLDPTPEHDALLRQFATILTYEVEERSGQVMTVPARPTSRTCAACGGADARSRESQARFVFIGCGHLDHADVDRRSTYEGGGTHRCGTWRVCIGSPVKCELDEVSRSPKIPGLQAGIDLNRKAWPPASA